MPANVYNANWLASNLVRKYPLDSLASCIDKEGNYFPDEIITDIQIAYPADLGEYCYIAAANITEHIVSILIAVDSTPVAALCISREDYQFRTGMYYDLTSLYDGVYGLITLGTDSSSKTGSWEFDNPLNSRILPSCCSPYVRPRVLSLSRPDDSEPLQGDILLTSGGDIKLSVDNVLIDGETVKAIFIGLDLSVDPRTVLKKYITACEVSTSMNSCALPYLESIGGAIPDCSGNIEIVPGDSGRLEISTEEGMIYISTDMKLEDVCGPGGGGGGSDSSSSSTQCPYPTVISDNICPVSTAGANVDYDFEGTDVDLYSNAVRVNTSSRSGMLYGNNPDKPNAITTTDEAIPTVVDIAIKPEEKVALALSFTDAFSNGNPKGSVHINIGNDRLLIDNGNVTVLCDETIGDDRKYWGDNLLTGCKECKVMYDSNHLYLTTSQGSTVLADLNAGLDGYTGESDYKLHVQIGVGAYLDGVRYV